MRYKPLLFLCLVLVGAACVAASKRGPFSPEAWPPTIDPAKKVHFISVDGALQPPNASWLPNLKILTGGDHPTERGACHRRRP
jgi:hypothetical protein